jgi:ADP-ribose pyrophosphatase YjhB (NUDIX family)
MMLNKAGWPLARVVFMNIAHGSDEVPVRGWIPEKQYEGILASVPIVCVDVVVFEVRSGRLGLIFRDTYDNKQGWCLIGGAVLRDEPIESAIRRQIFETLGGDVRIVDSSIRFLGVVEYFTMKRPGEFYDPRKHAVAMNYSVEIEGNPVPDGAEALNFEWFDLGHLPFDHFGFDQGRVLQKFGLVLDADLAPRLKENAGSE